jgi:predicted metal-dependent hydrolase
VKFDPKARNMAYSLQRKITAFDFIVSIMFMKNVMFKVKLLTETLETEDLNIIDAAAMIKSTIDTLETININPKSMDDLIRSAKQFSKSFGIDAEADFIKHHRRRLKPKRIDSNNDNQASLTLETFYRSEFKIVLDNLINSIKENLEKCIGSLKPLYDLLNPPLSETLLSEENLQDVMALFPQQNSSVNKTQLQTELEVLYNQSAEEKKVSDVVKISEKFKSLLPSANRLCRLLLTAPVTVASNERAFSKLKIVKNYLRTTQTNDRLNNLILLSSETDIVDNFNVNDIAKNWAVLKKRRVKTRL